MEVERCRKDMPSVYITSSYTFISKYLLTRLSTNAELVHYKTSFRDSKKLFLSISDGSFA
jgi:hypothetical protein